MTKARYITELTEDQVVALSDEEVERFIQYRMAEEGIPFLDAPTEPEMLPEEITPNVTLYVVEGIKFRTLPAAEAVQQAISKVLPERMKTNYAPGGSYRHHVAENNSDDVPQVTTQQVYSTEEWSIKGDALAKNTAVRQEYEKAVGEYRAAIEKAKYIRDEVWSVYNETRERQQRLTSLAAKFEDYKRIALGDELMAMQFLLKAYDLDDETITRLRGMVRVWEPTDEQVSA